MSLAPQKKIFSGIIKKQRINVGSKSEYEAVVLDTGISLLKLRFKGGNPFKETALDAYVGKRVRIEGYETPGMQILIESHADIAVMGRKITPKGPKL